MRVADETVSTPPPSRPALQRPHRGEVFVRHLVGPKEAIVLPLRRELRIPTRSFTVYPRWVEGRYQTNWRVLSTNGHITTKALSFTVATLSHRNDTADRFRHGSCLALVGTILLKSREG